MTREQAIEYVSFYVDDAGSPDHFPVDSETRLVGWQCGFEPLFVAVRSGYGWHLEGEEAEELARDLLDERGWFAGEAKDADYIF